MMSKMKTKHDMLKLIIAAGILAAVVAASPTTATALVSPAAQLTLGGSTTERFHPVLPPPNSFNIYTGSALGLNGWTSIASQAINFNDGSNQVVGLFHSEVWRNDADGRLLFAYKIDNTGTRGLHYGDMEGFPDNVDVVDCGVLHVDGDDTYAEYDVMNLARAMDTAGKPQLRFYFEALGDDRMLPAGENSTWFYAETDATDYTHSLATIMNSSLSASGIDVLVPVPEPATVVLLAGSAVALLIRRRRRLGR